MNSLDAVREAISELLQPAHFYAASSIQLEFENLTVEQTPWEILRGQLIPGHLTRNMEVFESWNVFMVRDGQRSGEPVLSVKLDAKHGQLHIVRGLLCWTWEGYHAGDNVYLSREVQRWVRELVRTFSIDALLAENLSEELALWLFRAVVGLSRLPLTSLEAPLPAFVLGELAYFRQDLADNRHEPLASWRQLLTAYCADWQAEQQSKWLEFLLRCLPADDVGDAAAAFVNYLRDADYFLALLRAVFNDVSLSPYTDFVDKTLVFLHRLVASEYLTAEQHIGFMSWLLRRLARHLTAYDLITFHHRGANYPDALLLDAALKDYLRLLEQYPALFMGDDANSRLRRRALRLACLHRRRYEGLPVPDAPTSPGENMRVLPPPHVRVPEEQILNPAKRTKRLYAGDPLTDYVGQNAPRVLRECGRDLQRQAELRELGMAVFVERPLAAVRNPGEPDCSPLLAHETYSKSVAERALQELAREPVFGMSAEDLQRCHELLAHPWPGGGIPASTFPADPRRVVSLADATKAAGDFVILRTLPGSVRAFCSRLDVAAALRESGIDLDTGESWLVVSNATSTGKPGVLIRDQAGKSALQLEIDADQGVKCEESVCKSSRNCS
jgi:hypothetical protein